MALSRVQTQVINGSVINTNSGTVTSSAVTFDATDISADITFSSSTAGTPASGDYVDWWILYQSGSATGVGAAANAYDTVEHAQYLGRTDNYATNTPGEQPAQKTMPIRVSALGFKIYAVGSAAAGTRNQTLYASVSTQRAA